MSLFLNHQITVTSWARRWEIAKVKKFVGVSLAKAFDRKVKPFIYLRQKTLPHPLSVSYSTLLQILKNCPTKIFLLQKRPKKFSTLKKFPKSSKRPQNLLVTNTKQFKHILKHFKYLNHPIQFYTSSLKKVASCIVHYRQYPAGSSQVFINYQLGGFCHFTCS